MPVIRVMGMPNDARELASLVHDLKRCVSEITELHLTPEQISVFFPPDLLPEVRGHELIVCVEGLFAKLERTTPVVNKLSGEIMHVIGKYAVKYLESCQLVEVFVQSFPQTGSFVTFKDLTKEVRI